MGMTFSVGGDKGAHSDCFTQFWSLNLFFPHTLIYTCPPQAALKKVQYASEIGSNCAKIPLSMSFLHFFLQNLSS